MNSILKFRPKEKFPLIGVPHFIPKSDGLKI